MSFQMEGGSGAFDAGRAMVASSNSVVGVGGYHHHQEERKSMNGYADSVHMPVMAAPSRERGGVSHLSSSSSDGKSENGPPTPVSQTAEERISHVLAEKQQQQQPPQHSFQLPVHTVQMQMPIPYYNHRQHLLNATTPAPAPPPPAAPPAAAQVPVAVAEEEVVQEAEEEEEPAQPIKRTRRTKERIRRIHLPVREGMDELSSSEGSGSEWDEPVLAEGQKLPPGYSGRRRVKKPTDGKIKPAYYYPTEGHTRGVPVFEPTYEEFKDFNS